MKIHYILDTFLDKYGERYRKDLIKFKSVGEAISKLTETPGVYLAKLAAADATNKGVPITGALSEKGSEPQENLPGFLMDPGPIPLRSSENTKNLGYMYIKCALKEMGLRDFFEAVQDNSRIQYSLNDVFTFLVYSRILTDFSINKSYEQVKFFSMTLTLRNVTFTARSNTLPSIPTKRRTKFSNALETFFLPLL